MNKLKKELNTSCEATFKDGRVEQFNSIEEASEKTGISIAAIRIRCNKSGTGGKDGTIFRWLDEHTKRSYQAKKSRSKGSSYELQIIKELTDIGYAGLVSSRSQSKRLDNAKIDIAETEDKLPCYIQCKNTANIPSISSINSEVGFKDRPLSIFWKKSTSRGEEYVVLPKEFFYTLLKCYHDNI